MNSHVILISGKMGSGKSTLSEMLGAAAKNSNMVPVHLKFAAPLYEIHDDVLNKMERFTGKKRLKKDRLLLQLLGTEWGRATFGVDIWAEILHNTIATKESQRNPFTAPFLFIVDDCRFENEFDAFPEALRVRLECPPEVRKTRAESWSPGSHPSEKGLDKYSMEDRFDSEFHTDDVENTPAHMATLIIGKLKRESWIEKRESYGT